MDLKTHRKLQLIQLDILKEVDRICSCHNIMYYMVGGTLLGAIRHHGFIPWDVDIDIAMPRTDYEKFQEVCQIDLNHNYKLLNYRNTNRYLRPHILISLKNTKLYTKYYKYNKHLDNYGIFMDVFPLDNVPDSHWKRVLFKIRISFWKMLRKNIISCSYTDNPLKQFAHHVIRFVFSPISLNWVNKRFDDTLKSYANEKTQKKGAIGTGRLSFDRESIENVIFGNPCKIEFEGFYFNAPEHYDDWLKKIYGDYMTFPSKQEQDNGYNYFEKVVFN